MLDLPLTRADEDLFVDALTGRETGRRRIKLEVEILNSDEKPIGSLSAPSPMVVSGGVDVEAEEAVTRSLSLTLLDPKRKLAFVPDHPAQGGMYAENMISVRYCVWVRELDDWVDVPVFWGPLTGFEHTGVTVTIEAQGKESLGLAPHPMVEGFTLRKNTRVDDAVRRVMRQIGERRFDMPRLGRKLHEDMPVSPEDEAWTVVQGGETAEGSKRQGLIELTGDTPHQAFYDGRGRLRIRRQRKQRVFTFRDQYLDGEPTVRYDVLEAINYVKVRGGRPKGAKERLSGTAKLPAEHPLSPERLGRNGEKRYMAHYVDAPNLNTSNECDKRAEHILRAKARATIDVSFESLVIPHLEPLDAVAVETAEGRLDFDLKSYTIPLSASETMSVGYTKRIKQRKRRRKRER